MYIYFYIDKEMFINLRRKAALSVLLSVYGGWTPFDSFTFVEKTIPYDVWM